MARIRYVALLRGINIGGNNVIRMTDLRASFEAMGFLDVAPESHLSKIVQRPVYQRITIRNWNTTTRRLAMATAP